MTYGLRSDSTKFKIFSGFLPPDFYSIQSKENDCPLNLECYKDYNQGLEVAKIKNKPILLDFTGWACVNCRKIEENVWSKPDIYEILYIKYISVIATGGYNFNFPERGSILYTFKME